jgi:hypothetical protein
MAMSRAISSGRLECVVLARRSPPWTALSKAKANLRGSAGAAMSPRSRILVSPSSMRSCQIAKLWARRFRAEAYSTGQRPRIPDGGQPWPQRKSLPRTTVRCGSKVTSRSLIPEENPSGSPAGRKSRFAVAATPPTSPSATVPTRSLGLPTKSTPAICLRRHRLRRNRNAEGEVQRECVNPQ